MPCVFCCAPEEDPARGPSRWAVGVRDGEQVLVCPVCQQGRDLGGDLEACPRCRSIRLSRRIGVTACRGCGWHSTTEEWVP
jgi:uncharacterized C2H2 Zn-finger protein